MNGLRIGAFTPCYRGQVNIEHAYALLRDMAWALGAGHAYSPFRSSGCSIERARNWAVVQSLRCEHDLLLMMDADVATVSPVSGLERLVGAWRRTRAAVVGAVVMLRGGARANVVADPQTGHMLRDDGIEVGTGLMLVDVRQVARIAPPWFRTRYSDDGTQVVASEDIAFCRLVRARGLRVEIEETLETQHLDEVGMLYSPPAAEMLAEDDARQAVAHGTGTTP